MAYLLKYKRYNWKHGFIYKIKIYNVVISSIKTNLKISSFENIIQL